MKRLSLVALGGAIGSLTRYLLSESITSHPLAIFVANIIGVLIAGWTAFHLIANEDLKAFLIPGVAGGMTTFSSVALIHAERNSISAIAYFYGMLAASLIALYICRPRVPR